MRADSIDTDSKGSNASTIDNSLTSSPTKSTTNASLGFLMTGTGLGSIPLQALGSSSTLTLSTSPPVIPSIAPFVDSKVTPLSSREQLNSIMRRQASLDTDTSASASTTFESTASDYSIQPSSHVMLQRHDLRLKLATYRALISEDPLFQAACPGGMAPIEIDPLTFLPVPSLLLKEGHRVVFAKKVLDQRIYKYSHNVRLPLEEDGGRIDIQSVTTEVEKSQLQKKNSTETVNMNKENISISTIALLSKCEQFEGERLGEREFLVDLSLEIDVTQLITYLKSKRSGKEEVSKERVDTWFAGVFSHIVAVSEAIENTYSEN
jgi:hypothetical protein